MNLRVLIGILAGITFCFGPHLIALGRFAFQSDLYSHLLLIPVVSGYFMWTLRGAFVASRPNPTFAAAMVILALAAVGMYAVAPRDGQIDDRLALGSLALLCCYGAALACFLGRRTLAPFVMPLGLLLFLIPFPIGLLAGIEHALQVGSAWCAFVLFQVAGTPFVYDNLVFQLPNFSMQVAPECSGIHSTLTLFITSIVAAHVFLGPGWKRWVLVLMIFPLSLVRNGLRIFIIGELCVKIGPHMIDSYIHRHGGPIFFAASLIPFGFVIWLLMKRERIVASDGLRCEKEPAIVPPHL